MRNNTEKTCKDYEYTGVKCCDSCHSYSEFELVTIKIDGKWARVCCAFRRFFYPEDPGIGLTPEEKLLRAIFGEKTVHDPNDDERYDPPKSD
jgi:hypothetical protein